MKPSEHDVLYELDRITQANILSPQEGRFLAFVVQAALAHRTGRLYQKALADDLDVASPKQVGVLATRVRSKLQHHYGALTERPLVRIELSPRGYAPAFVREAPVRTFDDQVQALVDNAKVAIDQRTLPGAATSLRYLDRALLREPDHPILLSLKAYCLATRSLYGTLPRQDLEHADWLVTLTRSAPSRPWESCFAEACVQMALHWDWQSAGEAFDRAASLSRSESQYQPWHTTFLSAQGRAAEAVALLRVAVSRAHDSPIIRADLASALIYAGRLDEADETLSDALDLFGSRAHYLLHVHRAILLEARGDSRGALVAIDRAPLRWPRTAITLGFRALFSGLAGDIGTARRHFLKLRAARALSGAHIPAGQLGLAALGVGEIKTAMHWLREGAVAERDPNFVLIGVYPFFRHLHHVPAFRELVAEMGLTLSGRAGTGATAVASMS
jgi:tetratricopeptide (TPR) repeat protein